jgi:putative ABC transport system permease protein
MIDPTVLLLLVLLAAVGLVSALLAARNRLDFRIAMRNVRRGRGRTVLLLLGLLVGTTIISGSLVVGDTVQQLSVHYTYLAAGFTDESIYSLSSSGGFGYFPYATYAQIASLAGSNPSIAGITPEIIDTTQGFDRTSGVPQTNINLIAADGNQSQALGSFVTTTGTSLRAPDPGRVFLDEAAAADLNASVGDTVVLFGPNTTIVSVQAIVQENVRGAYLTGGLGGDNLFMDLATAQAVQNSSGLINFIAVTNIGSQSEGAGLSDSVSAFLNTTLTQVPGTSTLSVHEPLADGLSQAEQSGTGLLTVFLVLGLFSIVAGAMLIVGIFIMLAEERKGEMGMLRAIGLRRSDLVLTYYFEGLVYAVGSAFAGTLLGVVAGYLLTYAFSVLLASGTLTSNAILSSFSVTGKSLIISYVLGFLLTLITVFFASRRASRLNIVRAIRDIPEPPPALRVYTRLAYLGALLAVVGALILGTTARGSVDISDPLIGGALLILGVGMIGSRFLQNRIVFTAVGVGFLLWTGVEPLHTALLGVEHSGGIFVVFVEGIIMVVGALLVYIFNASILVRGLNRLAEGGSGRAPITRVALSYPSRQPTRTAINLTIFALVVFTMVAIATFGATVSANLQSTISQQTGGYDVGAFSTRSIPDLPGQVANNSTLAHAFVQVVPFISGSVAVTVRTYDANPFEDRLLAAPTGAAPSSNFYTTNRFTFTATSDGMTTAQVMAQLQTDPQAAIVDQSYDPAPGGVGGGGGPTGPHPLVIPGTSILLTRPGSNSSTNVTVIGILAESLLGGIWVNPQAAASIGYQNTTVFLFSVRPGVSPTQATIEAKKAFFADGLVLFDLGAILASSISTTQGFIGLLEIFVGLGLAVGIAAMGILALRAVVERRREIGMLRAQGFTQGMILKAFVLEYSFVTLLGLAIGMSLGILIVYNLSLSPSAAASGVATFSIPWANIVTILVLAYALAMLAIAAPSIRASRIPPADAVRATE